MDGMKFRQSFGHNVERNRKLEESLTFEEKLMLLDQAEIVKPFIEKFSLEDLMNPKGRFKVQHLDKDGNLKGEYEFPNGITNVGKNKILDVMFNGTTPLTTWYIGLIDNAGFSALAAADTMASHTGWAESTAYTESTRVAWGQGSAASQSITNATPAQFDINATGTMYGIFLTSDNTKGGTSGTLWTSGAFSSTVSVSNGDQLNKLGSPGCEAWM